MRIFGVLIIGVVLGACDGGDGGPDLETASTGAGDDGGQTTGERQNGSFADLVGDRVWPEAQTQPDRIALEGADITLRYNSGSCSTHEDGTATFSGPEAAVGTFWCELGYDLDPGDTLTDFSGCGPDSTIAVWRFAATNTVPFGDPLWWSTPLEIYEGSCPGENYDVGCIVADCATRGDCAVVGWGCVVYETIPGGCDRVERTVNCGGEAS